MDREQLGVVCERIGLIGGAYYFEPETFEAAERAGLDGMQAYVLGRGGVLGDVDPAVVASAFGYFNPAMIDEVWRSAVSVVSPRRGAALYAEACEAFGRAKFAGGADLVPLCAALDEVRRAVDPRGLPFYAAHAVQPLPDDPPGRVMRLVALLREWRGAAHLAAVVACGLAPKTAHHLRRPHDMGLFGWDEEEAVAVTDGDRRALAQADALTDQIVAPAYDTLKPSMVDDLLQGLAAVEAAL